jgi:pimeloyl-ACP methyl ester carboxylesterase
MSTFVLVHGAWHGSWCWTALIRELEDSGHRAVASDLPCDVTDAGWDDYANVVLESGFDGEPDVVLVGHSLGGGVVPIVATRARVARMVLLCSYPPEPGRSLNEVVGEEPDLTDGRASVFRDSCDEQGRYVWPDFESARRAMYSDCSLGEARWAFGLLRPQATTPFTEPWPLAQWPEVPMSVVVCSEDQMGSASCLTRMARRRFGVEAVRLPGGHSPFLSRPAELARTLVHG